jgi:biopolymer transport protein TolQ
VYDIFCSDSVGKNRVFRQLSDGRDLMGAVAVPDLDRPRGYRNIKPLKQRLFKMIDVPFVFQIPAAFSIREAAGQDVVQMILHAGPVVKFVMLVLLLFSISSWAIMFMKYRLIRRAKQETARFLDLFGEAPDLKTIYKSSETLTFSPVARLFRAGYAEFNRILKIQAHSEVNQSEDSLDRGRVLSSQAILDNLERSLVKATIDQVNRLEKAVSFLATAGNTAPFIGLFGTVWGIMSSFRGIGLSGSASLAVVAPGISEARVATAAGLAAAIPAVVAFNHFTQKISVLRAEMEIFRTDFISLVERQMFRKQVVGRRG